MINFFDMNSHSCHIIYLNVSSNDFFLYDFTSNKIIAKVHNSSAELFQSLS